MHHNKLYSILFSMLIFMSCGKSGGSSPAPVPEEAIAFTVDIDQGQNIIYPVLSARQDAKITISSKLTTDGVTINVLAKKDTDNSVFINSSYQSGVATVTVPLDNLAPGAVYTVTITVTSKTTAANSAVKTFKIGRK
jgi:hypothetical protein